MIQHEYSTKQKSGRKFRLPLFKTDQGKFSVSFVGSNLWNMFPTDLRMEISRTSFRKTANYNFVIIATSLIVWIVILYTNLIYRDWKPILISLR